jgi:formamidopyrimidine-DNA glycosylase
MPELPDITLYVEALEQRIVGARLDNATIINPFLLRTVEPAVETLCGRTVVAVRRLGKRIAIGLEEEHWLIFHLMIAGRLHWAEAAAKATKRNALARFEFSTGTVVLTEAGSKRRASLHVVQGEAALTAHDPGGVDPLTTSEDLFASQLRRGNHTLKRALTDPRLFSGIGNAYSDEILHRARLSPFALSGRITDDEIARLQGACHSVLNEWIDRLRSAAGSRFPGGVTAFRDGMAVHGRYRQPCPVCGTSVQRIRYAENETNYCPTCQTGGRVLADRSLSRLLKGEWPETVDDL